MTDANSITAATPPPTWVKEMHEHFREKGFYRAEDVQRVLGDPCTPFEMRATTDLSELTKNLHK